MEDENRSSEASQSQEQEVSVDDLHRAAEEARQEVETPETGEQEQEEQHQEAPEDNSEKSRLGRKVAAYKQELEELKAQHKQVVQIIQMYAQQEADRQQRQQPYEEDEYIPTDKKGFLSFLEQVQHQKMTQAQREQMTFAQSYIGAMDEMGKEEDDPALFSEIKKLTTEPGQPFNLKYSNDPVADAERNFYKAKAHVLKQRISRGKEPENPFKGGKPDNPLGSGSSNTVKGAPKTLDLDPFAKRAAAAWGYKEKDLKDMGF